MKSRNAVLNVALVLTLIAGLFAIGCSSEKPPPADPPTNESDSSDETSSTNVPHRPKPAPPSGYYFEPPIRLVAAGEVIAVDSPGYAGPTMADVDGDGKEDLVVGQFAQGAMRLFRNIAEDGQPPQLASAEWIKTDGEKAVVPGVW